MAINHLWGHSRAVSIRAMINYGSANDLNLKFQFFVTFSAILRRKHDKPVVGSGGVPSENHH